MKVAINLSRVGDLSVAALFRIAELKGVKLAATDDDGFWSADPPIYGRLWCSMTFSDDSRERRTDPALIRAAEELGEEAGRAGALEIIEIPDGIEWGVMCDSSGREWVAEKHRTWPTQRGF